MLLAEEQAKLDCNAAVDESIIRQYDERAEAIEELERELDQISQNQQGHLAAMEAIHQAWLPPLEALVRRISESFSRAFRRLGCAGEVHLHTPEREYADFGLRIMVKFRAESSLQQLTVHQQSGGERSVSTMLYLMSLQSMTKCPFRVVDEINQGMDALNERRVFEQVVHCSSEIKSQYFLATPKLLANLPYDDKMRILCVFNGRWIVDHRQWNLGRIIARRREQAGA